MTAGMRTPGSPSGWGAAQWAEGRPSLTGPGFSLQNHNLEAVMSITILAGGWGGQRQEDYEFKVILGYVGSFRRVWAT